MASKCLSTRRQFTASQVPHLKSSKLMAQFILTENGERVKSEKKQTGTQSIEEPHKRQNKSTRGKT